MGGFGLEATNCEAVSVREVGQSVGKIGLGFEVLPPAPVLKISKIQPSTWAEQQGLKVGDEIIDVNGKSVSDMTPEKFKAVLRVRPIRFSIRSVQNHAKTTESQG